MRFQIPDMSCGVCVEHVTTAIHSVDPAAEVTADLQSKMVTVISSEPQSRFVPALVAAGYAPA
jgi:copper chaperone